MDAKMDSGYVPPGDTFEPDVDFSQPLDPTEALWIMDQLLCLEIAWLDGYPLSQTVFTSLHIDRLLNPKYKKQMQPSELAGKVDLVQLALLGYCMALVACCREALKLIQSQNFYEEEDFVTHLFGRELLSEFDNFEADSEISWVYTEYGKRQVEGDVHEGILMQLEFRRTYLKLLTGQNLDWTASEFNVYWPDMVRFLERVKANHSFSTPCPTAFSEKVQRQLATSTPPRPMLQISWDVACNKWKSLSEDMIAVQLLTSSEIIRSSAGLHKAVWTFSYRAQPCCLARAEIQSILFGHPAGVKGEVPHHQLLLQDIRELVLTGDVLTDAKSFEVEVPSDPRHICSRLMEGFMDKAIEEFLNLYRMVCQNRSRIRRTFTQAIPILDELEAAAMTTDQELRKSTASLRMKVGKHTELLEPLTYWTRFHKLRIMAWTVQLGFETEIYCPDELGSMYWFLAHLSGQRARLVERIAAFTADRMRQAKERLVKRECGASIDYLTSLQNIARITESMAEALSTFYKLLMYLDIITPPKRDFAEVKLLYEARMKPFLGVWNDTPPSPDDFEEWRRQVDTVANMCGEVDGNVKAAKSLITTTKKMTPEQAKYVGTEEEWKKDWKQTETTCVAISVAISQLLRARQKHGDAALRNIMECKPEKKYHEWWVVPQLKEKAK
jgi:hypothetical protein